MTGTLLNAAAVLIGGLVGLAFGTRFSDRARQTVLAGLGLFTAAIGLRLFLQTQNPLYPLGGIVLGALIGEGLRIEDRLAKEVEMPTGFLLGGESIAGGALDLARTVVRRAERRVALLVDQGEVENRQLLRYLNRASSICFLLILVSYRRTGIAPTMAKEG